MSGRRAAVLTRGAVLGLVLGAAVASAETHTQPPPVTNNKPDGGATAAASQATSADPDSAYHTNEGWDADWAMLFSLNNILSATTFLASPVEGNLGAQYFLSHNTAIRMGLGFTRTSNPVSVTKVVNTAGDQTVATYTLTPGGGDAYNLAARVDYLYRFLDKPLSPYVGAGVFGGWTLNKLRYTDNQTIVDQVTAIDNNLSTFTVGLHGVAGAEWRFNPSFGVYADYNITVNVWNNTHTSNRTAVQNSVGGVTSTNQSVTTNDTNSWLTVNTGISQGASLGLELFF